MSRVKSETKQSEKNTRKQDEDHEDDGKMSESIDCTDYTLPKSVASLGF